MFKLNANAEVSARKKKSDRTNFDCNIVEISTAGKLFEQKKILTAAIYFTGEKKSFRKIASTSLLNLLIPL